MGFLDWRFVIGFGVLGEVLNWLLLFFLGAGKWHVGNVLLNDIRFFLVGAAVPPVLVLVTFYCIFNLCALSLRVVVNDELLIY